MLLFLKCFLPAGVNMTFQMLLKSFRDVDANQFGMCPFMQVAQQQLFKIMPQILLQIFVQALWW